MALKRNPLTGQLEDDGLPEDPNAVAVETAPVDDTVNQVPAGTNPGAGAPGSPENPLVTTIASSQKPVSEVQTTTRGLVESDRAKEAATTLQARRVLENVSQDAVTDQAAAEARVQAAAADQKATEIEKENSRRREAETKRQQDRQQWIEGEKSIVAAEVAARKRSIDPEGDFWKGRPAAKVFSNVLQALGEIAAGVATPNDPTRKSRVDTTLENLIAAHKAKLVGEWEATKEARQLHKENRAAWEDEKDRIETRAANESEAQLRLIEARLEADIAKLGPDKAKAAAELLRRSSAKADAALDLERADKFNRMTEREEVKRQFPAGSGGDPTTGGLNPVLDPFTGQVIAQLPKERMVEGKDARNGQGALNALRKWNGAMKDFLSKNGPVASKWNPEARNQFDTFVTEGAGLLTVANNTGVLNDGEYGRYVKQMTPQGVLGLFTSQEGVDRGLDEIVRGAERKQVGRVQVLVPGYKPPQPANSNGGTKGDARFSKRTDAEMKTAYKKALSAGRKDHAKEFEAELKARGLWGK